MSKDFKVKNGLQVTTHITASGNISSSGTITGNAINVNGTNVLVAGGVDISDDTNLVGGTGITLTGDTLSTTDSEIVHDNLSGFVANEHIDHSGVSITAGAGLNGGGNITSTRTLSVDSASMGGFYSASMNDFTTTGFIKGNHITASGNISSSGTIIGSNLSGTNTGDQSLVHLAVTGSDVTFNHITASGNISSSLTGSFRRAEINGVTQFNGNVLVGEDDTGHTVQLFGATSGKQVFWSGFYDYMNFADNTKLTFGTPQTGGGHDSSIVADGSKFKIQNLLGDLVLNPNGSNATGVIISGSSGGSSDLTVLGHISASGNIVGDDSTNITNIQRVELDTLRADATQHVNILLGTSGIKFDAEAGDTFNFNGELYANVDLNYYDSNEEVIFNIDQSVPAVTIGVLGGVADTTLHVNGTSKFTQAAQFQNHITSSGNISASGGFFVSSSGNVMINSDSTGSMATHLGALSVNYGGDTQLTGSLSVVGDGYGDIVKIGGTTTTKGKVYFLQTDSTWVEVNATNATTGADKLLAVALGTNSDIDGMLLKGFVKLNPQGTIVVGAPIYMNTSAGNTTFAAPSTSGNIVRILGYNLTGGEQLYFNPDTTFIEVA